MEHNLVFGPGDLRGDKLKLSEERKMLIYRFYEVYPHDHKWAGRRRFRRCAMSVRKGVGKSEFAALIAAAELSLTAPVRCIGFDKRHRPLGGPVREVYIPLVATTEQQIDETVYGVLKTVVELSPIKKQFDIGLARILRADGSGKAIALANAPDARDGARTSFSVADEVHRWTRPALKASHKTMLANLPKRKKADPWALEVTTAPCPGEDSVAEDTMAYARAIHEGLRAGDSDLCFFHRQADERYTVGPDNGPDFDLTVAANVHTAVLEASGPDAEWSDIEGITSQFRNPKADMSYLRRVWLNQMVRASDKAFDIILWDKRVRYDYTVPKGALITLGFDGAISEDSTAIVGTELSTGYQWRLGLWEKPFGQDGWKAPEDQVDGTMDDAFSRYEVWRLYADPYFWENMVSSWIGRYGTEPLTHLPRVVAWPTNVRGYKMPAAVRSFMYAMLDAPHTDLGIEHDKLIDPTVQMVAEAASGLAGRPVTPRATNPGLFRLSHSDDAAIRRHVSNSYRKKLTLRDASGDFLWVIQKESPNSPNKIDGAMASILSWEARRDAVAAGLVNAEVEQDWRVDWL